MRAKGRAESGGITRVKHVVAAMLAVLLPAAQADAQSASVWNFRPQIAAIPVETHLGVSLATATGPDTVLVGTHVDKFPVDEPTGRSLFGGFLLRADAAFGGAPGYTQFSLAGSAAFNPRSGQSRRAVYCRVGAVLNLSATPRPTTIPRIAATASC